MDTLLAENIIEKLARVKVDIKSPQAKGRNVWCRIALNGPGAVHVEIAAKDKIVNDQVMPTITAADMALSSQERYKIYRARCAAVAKAMNEKAVLEGKMTLFIASNGHLTRTAKLLIWTLLPGTPTHI